MDVAGTSDQSSGAHDERNNGKERVIVFVHGIYGSAAGTWTCAKTGSTWPKMLLGDHAFDNADVYVAQNPNTVLAKSDVHRRSGQQPNESA